MNDSLYTHLVAVGACYIDTILTVPEYPSEDAKQRASSISRRRGGNCPNTLEVLQQLLPISFYHNQTIDESPKSATELILLSTLPSTTSPDTRFITESLNPKSDGVSPPPSRDVSSTTPVNFSHTFYRPSVNTAASSYIIQSQTANSRTIVNYNALDEMSLPEFQNAIISLLSPSTDSHHPCPRQNIWFHFEGRIPDVLCQCIKWLRSKFPLPSSRTTSPQVSNSNPMTDTGTDRALQTPHQPTSTSTTITISIEIEKPQRPGLEDLADLADVVFYSRSWAEGKGHTSAQECLSSEARRIRSSWPHARSGNGSALSHPRDLVLCCTWGSEGASVLESNGDLDVDMSLSTIETTMNDRIVTCPSWSPPSTSDPSPDQGSKVVDTIGAGDTWIAGMLFCLMTRPAWSMRRKVDFANELAGRKVRREGFAGLGWDMRSTMMVE